MFIGVDLEGMRLAQMPIACRLWLSVRIWRTGFPVALIACHPAAHRSIRSARAAWSRRFLVAGASEMDVDLVAVGHAVPGHHGFQGGNGHGAAGLRIVLLIVSFAGASSTSIERFFPRSVSPAGAPGTPALSGSPPGRGGYSGSGIVSRSASRGRRLALGRYPPRRGLLERFDPIGVSLHNALELDHPHPGIRRPRRALGVDGVPQIAKHHLQICVARVSIAVHRYIWNGDSLG